MLTQVRIKLESQDDGSTRVNIYKRVQFTDICDCDIDAKDNCEDCTCGEACYMVETPHAEWYFHIRDSVDGKKKQLLTRILKDVGITANFEEDSEEFLGYMEEFEDAATESEG